MNKISNLFFAMLFISLVAPSFAHAVDIVIPTGDEVDKCVKLQGKATDYYKWSIALEDIPAIEGFSPKKTRGFYKFVLNKIYEDIYSVRDLVGITEKLTVLEQTPKLLKRVKSNSDSIEEANELMLDKRNQLDRAMYDTLLEASERLTDCKIPARISRAAEKKSSASEPESTSESALVQ